MISKDEALEMFTYDQAAGELIWKHHHNPSLTTRMKGQVAGTVNSAGYHLICINQHRYRTAYIIWTIETGSWPRMLKHINGNRQDNRFENLRLHGSKHESVYYRKATGKWAACIHLNSVKIHVGTYETEELAHQAHLDALLEAARV